LAAVIWASPPFHEPAGIATTAWRGPKHIAPVHAGVPAQADVAV